MITENNEIRDIVKQIAFVYKDAIEHADATATLKMWDFNYLTEFDGRWFNVIFEMPLSKNGFPYWRAIENGTKPHWPNVKDIEEWIKIKPVVPKPNGKKVPTTKTTRFLD